MIDFTRYGLYPLGSIPIPDKGFDYVIYLPAELKQAIMNIIEEFEITLGYEYLGILSSNMDYWLAYFFTIAYLNDTINKIPINLDHPLIDAIHEERAVVEQEIVAEIHNELYHYKQETIPIEDMNYALEHEIAETFYEHGYRIANLLEETIVPIFRDTQLPSLLYTQENNVAWSTKFDIVKIKDGFCYTRVSY